MFLTGYLFAQSFKPQNAPKKQVERNANVSFYETDNQACTGRVTFTNFVNFCQSRLSGLSLCAESDLNWNDRAYTSRS